MDQQEHPETYRGFCQNCHLTHYAPGARQTCFKCGATLIRKRLYTLPKFVTCQHCGKETEINGNQAHTD